MTYSSSATTSTFPTVPPTAPLLNGNAAVNTQQKEDKSDKFIAATKALYALFLAISDLLPFLTNKLESSATSLKKANDIQAIYDTAINLPQDKRKPGEDVAFGGGKTTANIENGQKILDYLHSIGIAMDFPAGYSISNPVRLTKDNNTTKWEVINGWSLRLTGYIDNIKTRSSITTTEADGVQKSANAAIDFTTTFLKGVLSALQTVAANLRM